MVEQIIRCIQTSRRSRSFEVKWPDFDSSHNSILPESEMKNCAGLLKQSLLDNKLKPTYWKGDGLLGASNKTKDQSSPINHNRNIWMNARQVIDYYNKYRPKHITLKLESFTTRTKLNLDKLYLIKLSNHCYIGLYKSEEDQFHLVDGTNDCLNDLNAQDRLKLTLKRDIKLLKFNQQDKVDHCGSSADIMSEQDDDNNEYMVEEIVKVIYNKTKTRRSFEVKWKDFDSSQNSILSENQMKNCAGLIRHFLLDSNLKPTYHRGDGKLGASLNKGINYNRSNWITPKQVIDYYNMYKPKYIQSKLEQFTTRSKLHQDKMYLIKLNSHCYINLYSSSEDKFLSADGTNDCIQDLKTQNKLKLMLEGSDGCANRPHPAIYICCSSDRK